MCNDRLVSSLTSLFIVCISPNRIPNPNYHSKYKSIRARCDTESFYLSIPCGYCKECIALKQMYFVQRVQMEALNSHLFFSTLTYNQDSLPILTTSTGYNIPYADINHLQLLFKRLRNDNAFGRPFRYFAVSERGSEKGRPHFHILWFLPKYDGEDLSDGYSLNHLLFDEILKRWAVNTGSKRVPNYVPLCTYQKKFFRGKMTANYDTHFVVPALTTSGISSVAYYVSKYMLKVSSRERRLQQAFKLNLPSDEYDSSWNLVKSHSLRSEHFGLNQTDSVSSYAIVKYLRDCVRRSDVSKHYPCYFNPDTGASFPLASYYRSKDFIFSADDYWRFFDSPIIDDEQSYTHKQIAISEFERISRVVDKDLSIEFNFLFD